MERLVALLRGVNVGGHQLKMADLRVRLTELGCTDVETYIQSGNVLLSPPPGLDVELDTWLESAISTLAGYDVPVVTRAAAQIAETVRTNPYPQADPSHLHVVFYRAAVPTDLLNQIDLSTMNGESFQAVGANLYMHLPNGMGRATLPVQIEKITKRAHLFGTARNWKTVCTLAKLANSPPPD
jgi:uncharacterized protein (DUF1697 family)